MKTMVLVAPIIVILFAAPIFARDYSEKYSLNELQIAFAKKNVLMGLRSDNTGLIESCLILISKIKIHYQETNIAEIHTVIDSLALASPSDMLRYKAYLVSTICRQPEWFDKDNAFYTWNAERFFTSAARLLHYKMLSPSAS